MDFGKNYPLEQLVSNRTTRTLGKHLQFLYHKGRSLRDILVESPLKAVSKKGNRQILLASLDVLIRHGYHAFTMREVAAQCGISVGILIITIKA